MRVPSQIRIRPVCVVRKSRESPAFAIEVTDPTPVAKVCKVMSVEACEAGEPASCRKVSPTRVAKPASQKGRKRATTDRPLREGFKRLIESGTNSRASD